MDAVLNWLWQGVVVAVALSGLLHLLDRARANMRYAVCWAALLLVVTLPAVALLIDAAVAPGPMAAAVGAPIVSVPEGWWTSDTVVAAAWAVWALACLVRFTQAMVTLRRARARVLQFPAIVESSLPCWLRVRDDGRRPALVLSPEVNAAAVLGGGAPVIAVAPSLVATLDADELDRVVIHEWAHVQRRDDVVNILQVLLRVVAGWHPAVWWIERRLHIEREIACDETAVALTGSPKLYAACLVKLAAVVGRERSMLPAPAALRASGLRARITRIVACRAPLPRVRSLGIAAGVVAALCVVATAAGDRQLVGDGLLTLPFDVSRVPDIRVGDGAPVQAPVLPPRLVPPSLRQGRAAAAAVTARSLPEHAPSPAVLADRAPLPAETLPVAPVTEPPADQGSPGLAAAEVSADAPRPSASLGDGAVVQEEPSPWGAAADQGVVIGKKSKEASLATAGFFTRAARRVAGAF
jgi:beta-lactamase regulating signal transducer with metallopeptidase domain